MEVDLYFIQKLPIGTEHWIYYSFALLEVAGRLVHEKATIVDAFWYVQTALNRQ